MQYKSTGFLEKNRDTISKELVNVMRESNLSICRTLMSLEERSASQGKETSLDGRVKINAAKHLVKILIFITFLCNQKTIHFFLDFFQFHFISILFEFLLNFYLSLILCYELCLYAPSFTYHFLLPFFVSIFITTLSMV